MLGLVLALMAVVGPITYLNGRIAVSELSSQVLDQASQRIDMRIQALLDAADSQSQENALLLRSGALNHEDDRQLTRFFYDAIRAHPELTYLSWTEEDDGSYCHATRDPTGALSIRTLRRMPDGRMQLADSIERDGVFDQMHFDPDKRQNDPRPRPFYVAAKQARGAVWTPTYVFLGKEGQPDMPGVTRATPVYGKNGVLEGVLTADFDLHALSEFLQDVRVGQHGFAFLLELRDDGPDYVIAHPQPSLLVRQGADG